MRLYNRLCLAIAVLGGLCASSVGLAECTGSPTATPTAYLCPTGATPKCFCASGATTKGEIDSASMADLCFFTQFSKGFSEFCPVLSTNAGGPTTADPPEYFPDVADHCLDANGTELCGFQLELSVSSTTPFASSTPFSPAPPLNMLSRLGSAGNTLRLNWIATNAEALSPISPSHLGVVSLASSGTFSAAKLTVGASSLAVKTDLTLVSVHSGVIAVPEPSSGPLWGAGLLALGLLIRIRFRHPGLLALGLLAASLGGAAAEATLVEAANRLGNPNIGLVDPSDLGTVLAGVGDLNGDGVEDVAIGLPNEFGGSGGVLLAFLRHDGTVNETQMLADGIGGIASGGLAASVGFGSALAILTDIDGPAGPGAVALAVSAPSSPPNGALWLLILSPSAPGSTYPVQVLSAVEVPTPIAVEALAAIGDLDGNNVPDLLLGHPSYAGTSCPGANCGAISALRLGLAGVGNYFLSVVEDPNGSAPQALFGWALAGLGLPHVAVGAPGYDGDRGAVSILSLDYGGNLVDWNDVSGILPSPLAPGDRFGAALSAIGDLDGNGLADLAVGLPGREGAGVGSAQAGSVAFLRPLDSGWPDASATELDDPGGELPEAFGPTIAGTPTEFGRALAAVDQDGDGDKELWVGAAADVPMTSEGIVWRIGLSDPDGDLLPDDLGDNCPGTHNPDQLDSDADGVGDECDNCPAVANGNDMGICTGGDDPSARGEICYADSDCGSISTGVCALNQQDSDADDVGDACEQVVVRLEETAADDWSLEIDCGAHNVEDLSIVLFAPNSQDDLNLDLGGDPSIPPGTGCTDPGEDFWPNPFGAPGLGGNGCDGVSGIGPTVDDPNSGVLRTNASGDYETPGPPFNPANQLTSGLRPNALYVWLEGSEVPGPGGVRRLCQAGDEGVFLANLEIPVGYSAPTDLAIGGSNHFYDFDFITTPAGSPASPASCIMKKPYSDSSPARRAAGDPPPPDIFVKLSPKPSPASGPQAWEVCFKTDSWMHRIKLAVGPPSGQYENEEATKVSFNRDDITWAGCNSSGCTPTGIYPIDNLSMIAPTSSEYPDSNQRRYIILEGSVPGWDTRLNSVLNSTSDLLHCIGEIKVTHGTSNSTHAPTVLMEDPYLTDLDNEIGYSSQVDFFNGVPRDVELSIKENQLCGSSWVFEDNDSDGVRVEADNCPHYSNPYQADLGGWDPSGDANTAGLGQDGIGDACQCGEGDGNGIISKESAGGNDLANLRSHLLGGAPDGFDSKRCKLKTDPVNTSDCTILDAVVLQRAFEGATTLPASPICATAIPASL